MLNSFIRFAGLRWRQILILISNVLLLIGLPQWAWSAWHREESPRYK